MEYDSLFVRIHGALISAEKLFATPFSLIDKDCTDEVKKVVEVLSNIVDKLEDKVNDSRRLHLFIVLNTDFSAVPLIEDDENYCHLLNLLPKFSPYLYFRVMEHFEWFPYLGEVIIHCPEVLTFDILKCVGVYSDSVDIGHLIDLLHSLYFSMFEKILRIQDCESLKKKNMFVKIFQSLLAFSVSDILEKTDWKLVPKQQFIGKLINMFLNLLETCIYHYKRGWVGNQMDIYNISIDFDYENWNCVNHSINWSGHCLNHLLSKCKKLVMDISVDMYMSWSEVDLDEKQEKTLQMAVRESAYSCKEALSELSREEFPDVSMLMTSLQNFALKPKTEDDEISSADLDTIILNLDDPNRTREKWFTAFLNNPYFSTDNHISIMISHINLLRSDSALMFINKSIKYLTNNPEKTDEIEKLKQAVSDSVKQLTLVEQMDLLSKFYERHGNTQVLLMDTFKDTLTEVLNKITDNTEKKEELYPELVCSCIQSGSLVVLRLLKSSLNSREKCNITVTILQEFTPLSNLKVSATIQMSVITFGLLEMLKSVVQLLPQEKDNLIYLVTSLSKNALIDGQEFLTAHVMPLLQTNIQKKEWDKILFWLDLLLPFVDGSCGNGVVKEPLVLLAFLLEVLNQCRQKNPFHRRYSPLSGDACENCIGLISILVNRLCTVEPCKECEVVWLKNTASSLSPFTWYLVSKLWENSDTQLPDEENLLRWLKPNLGCETLSNLTPEERAKLVTSICKVFPLLTVSEWKSIGQGGTEELELFHVLTDGILVLCQVPQMRKNLSCLSQVISNWSAFVKVRTVPVLESAAHTAILSVFDKITIVTSEVPGEVMKVRLAQLMNVMQDILNALLKTAKSENTSDILTCIMSITDETLQTSLFKSLQSAKT